MQPAADALPDELTLFEYGTCSDTTQDAKLFERRESLRPYLGKWLTPFFDGKQFCLRASHYVGVLPFPDAGRPHSLLIAPKGCRQDWRRGLLRFLELLALVEGAAPPTETSGLQGQLGPHQFLLFLAYHYAGLLEELCRRDFRSYYRPEEDELRSHIRGRLRFPAYARLAVRGKPHALPCRWDEFTVDNWDNRILWAAARRLQKVAGALDPQAAAWVWQPFKGLLPWFSAVAEVPITAHDFRKSRLGRTSRYYRSALAWARLLIRGSDLPRAGGRVPPLVLDANSAFEKFAQVVVRAALHDDASWRYGFQPYTSSPFLTGQQGQDRVPDILLSSDSRGIRAVGDAKYKKVLERAKDEELDNGNEVFQASIKEDDWNQLYVYMRLKGASCGFFVVPFWNAEEQLITWLDDDQFRFAKSPCDGNAHLAVLGLNLLQPLTKVKDEAADRLRNWLASVTVSQ